MANRLMLCAGAGRRDGWKTLDADNYHGQDFIAMIPPLPEAVTSQEWDEIEWIHGVTSFYPWEAAELLSGCREIMKPGGKLTLEQPDARKAAVEVLKSGNPRLFFGSPDERNPLAMNRWAYTPESLTQALRAAGFQRIDVLPAQFHMPERDFRIEALA